MFKIIIPMAGTSSRFKESGFTLPKYMLYKKNKSLFNLSVSSFKKYFDQETFIFICRDIFNTPLFIDEECKLLGIKFYEIIMIDEITSGQAETVKMGIEKSSITKSDSILIFNIDTIRKDINLKENLLVNDGFIEVFKGYGDNWSYAKTQSKNSLKVVEVAEKKKISNYCSTGLYYFKNVADFLNSYDNSKFDLKEKYVAPLYNFLISNNKSIIVDVIDKSDVVFSGIPAEYYDLIKHK
tara:strand:+ start:5797 stop:6513 length:717 start_codon:yes stop_codon:yes gene_type:complete